MSRINAIPPAFHLYHLNVHVGLHQVTLHQPFVVKTFPLCVFYALQLLLVLLVNLLYVSRYAFLCFVLKLLRQIMVVDEQVC